MFTRDGITHYTKPTPMNKDKRRAKNKQARKQRKENSRNG